MNRKHMAWKKYLLVNLEDFDSQLSATDIQPDVDVSPCITAQKMTNTVFIYPRPGLGMFPLHIQQLCLPASVLSPPLTSTLLTSLLSLCVCLYVFVHKETTVLIFVLCSISLISA